MGTVMLAKREAAMDPAIRRVVAMLPRWALTVGMYEVFADFSCCGRKYQRVPATSRKTMK
jgi:hypothetical protein